MAGKIWSMEARMIWPLILFCACALEPLAGAPEAGQRPPNVILFLVDDMGWMDSSAYGSTYYETPNMERLAARAMRFTDAYAVPLCSPTRASILTGQYSSRHGITTASGHQPPQEAGFDFLPSTAPPNRPTIQPISKNYLEPSQYTLAEALRDAGYRTAHLGKWHLGLTAEYRPNRQGFDVTFDCAPDPGPPSYFSPYGVSPDGAPTGKHKVGNITDGPPGEYITDRLTDEAVRFIESNRDRPFFLNLWQYGVHGPWGHKEEYTRGFANKKDPRGKQANPIMASMLKSVDESLGRVLDALDALKLSDRTLLIFYSDNGGNKHSNTPGDRKKANVGPGHPRYAELEDWKKWAGPLAPTNNDPLRGGKADLFEGGCRVPLMVQWPGRVAAGSTSGAVVGPIDIYPTILEMIGLNRPEKQHIDGASFAPVLTGSGELGRKAFFNFFPHGLRHPPGAWVRAGDWKLIRWFETRPDFPSAHELYNLKEDVGEANNMAARKPELVKELDALIDGFLKDTGARVPIPNPAYAASGAAPAARRLADPFGGWVPKSCKAETRDGVLVVKGEGKSPFLGISNLKHRGPLTLGLRARGAGGPARVQWRTADQETFPPEGQTVEFALVPGDEWAEASVELPVRGSLLHLRLYLPAQSGSVQLDWVQLRPAGGDPQRWDFDASSR